MGKESIPPESVKYEISVLAFANHTVESAWCNTVDVNTFDYNPIVGQHPYWRALHMFCGFGGHGLAQMIGAADYFTMVNFNPTFHLEDSFRHDWRYRRTSLDIEAYSPQRLILRYPMREQYTWS